jgi:alanyl-tRNA synthetase
MVGQALARVPEAQQPTLFEGYEKLSLKGVEVVAAFEIELETSKAANPSSSGELADKVHENRSGVVLLDRTVFYAESGGQVGDRGEMRWEGGRAEVTHTTKDNAGRVLHWVTVVEGTLSRSTPLLDLFVSEAHRLPTQRNHTATHLLHAALRQVLGTGVRQAGSLVAPDHLRFDFTHGKPMSAEERGRVEKLVDDWVLKAVPTRITAGRDYKEAVAAGAMALFGEKYGDKVRTVEVPGFSLELCGGCHVGNTGEIGPFVLRAERGVASGVRRIEALTGEGALAYLRGRDDGLAAVESALGASGTGSDGALAAVAALKRELKERDAELAKLRLQIVSGSASEGGAGDAMTVDGVRLLVREVPPAPPAELRGMADALKAKLGSGVVVLGTREEGKVALVAAVTDDVKGRVSAGKLLKALASIVGGSGGGRDDFAQAGGKSPERLGDALAEAPRAIAALLAG